MVDIWGYFVLRAYYTFLGIYCFLNLVKTQIPRTVYVNNIPISFSICLATIGVGVFRCGNSGCRTFYFQYMTKGVIKMENQKLVRFLLTFFLGWIGSIIINHSGLKPEGYTSRTLAYFFLTIITFGIYGLVASICNLTFDPSKGKVIGYKKD